MAKKIYLFWYKHNEGHGNFGDELNPYLVEKLSGKKAYHINPHLLVKSRVLALKLLLHDYFIKKKSLNNIVNSPSWISLWKIPVVIGIGSVISQYKEGNIKVWGTGILTNDEKIQESKILAVRGKKTQERLTQLGIKAPDVIGDPALLLPLVYETTIDKKYKIGIIPHYVHYNYFNDIFKNSEVLVINLLEPIEKVITEICSCVMTYSTSLHGLIVSHAYQIPSLWIKYETLTKEIQLAGDNIKFSDYFSSVEIDDYQPYELSNHEDLMAGFLQIKNRYEKFVLPKKDVINKIQISLLSVAPFPLKENFKI